MSNALTADHIEAVIAAHPSIRMVGGVHDHDPGAGTHGHLFLYDRRTARTEDAVRRMFPVPVVVKPFIAHPGEPGPASGKHAMARAARYVTHEHPEQQAQGKALYADDEVIASPGWSWRADVDALNRYERVDPAAPARQTAVERLSRLVLAGALTPRDVHRRSPKVYLAKGAAYWEGLERRAAEWATEDRIAAEAAERQARRAAWEADREERERLAAEKAAAEKAAAAEAAAQAARQAAAEREAREAAERAYRESPEGKAEAARLAAEKAAAEQDARRRDMIDYIATFVSINGTADRREREVLAWMAVTPSCDGVPLTGLEDAIVDLTGRRPDQIDEELASFRRDVARADIAIQAAELHASDGDEAAFEKALCLRREWAGYPDLVRLSAPRAGLKRAWREQLYAASQPPDPSPTNYADRTVYAQEGVA